MDTNPSISSNFSRIRIIRAVADDMPVLLDLARSTFYTTWKPVNTHADLMDFLDTFFVSEKVLPELESPSIFTYLLVYSNDILTGYAKLRRDSGFVQLPGARLIEIEKFYFKVEFHGCGLATELMNHILQIAMTEKAEWLCLGVDVNNHRAIRFYEKFGFRVFGEKSFRVGAQVDTDQLMKRKIS